MDRCDCLHVSAGCVIAFRTGKFLRAKIIVARIRCTRLQNMRNARAYPRSRSIGRILDSQPVPGQHVRVNHRRTHVAMPQQLLHGPDVVAVTDRLAIHDSIREIGHRGIEVTNVVQGVAYSIGSVILQAASEGRRLAQPHFWIMIHEPAKWAGWQSTLAAAQRLDRLRQQLLSIR